MKSAAIKMVYRAWRYRLMLDRREIGFMRRNLKPGYTAVDIGAHKGAYAYWMNQAVTPHGRVVCFEPQPQLADYLNRMKASVPMERVEVVNLALSSRRGEMTLAVPQGGPSPAATLESGMLKGPHILFLVGVTTLDDFFGTDAPVHFIKCDVEGHEFDVFRGGERLLRTHHPVLLFECEDRHQRRQDWRDTFAFLEGLGYVGTFFSSRGMRPVREFDPVVHGEPSSKNYVNNFVFRMRPAPVRVR
ncbi:MAG TPA: FkbM family methyltransferase [Candidatus Eisenbacteria bacterium]|nr:FkbM family methyltransferase [Candidatus Eisenbacteria bacterium]